MVHNCVYPTNAISHSLLCQDQLILTVIVGSISSNLIPFITSIKTSWDAWITLANSYVQPSHKRLNQLSEDTRLIIEYMQQMNFYADKLAIMNALIDNKGLVRKIIVSLDDDYKH